MIRVCRFLIRGYRAAISPLLGPRCRYLPSCSHYTEEAIERFGVLRGGLLGLWRILRCHPFARGGVDLVPPEAQPIALAEARRSQSAGGSEPFEGSAYSDALETVK